MSSLEAAPSSWRWLRAVWCRDCERLIVLTQPVLPQDDDHDDNTQTMRTAGSQTTSRDFIQAGFQYTSAQHYPSCVGDGETEYGAITARCVCSMSYVSCRTTTLRSEEENSSYDELNCRQATHRCPRCVRSTPSGSQQTSEAGGEEEVSSAGYGHGGGRDGRT